MPARVIDPRRIVGIQAERVTDVASTDFPGHYPHEDLSWNLGKFRKNLTVKVHRLSNRSIDFDMVGLDASIANAFRRIMIAEVPSVCIEGVYVWNNTTVIQDEVLAHRLGLVPLNVDPALMSMKGPNDGATDRNTLVFQLKLKCERNPSYPTSTSASTSASTSSSSSASPYINSEVLSSHLTWSPAGEQDEVFAGKPPAPTNGNIVLAKMRPGQEVEMELHAVKGVGKDHAKYTPVATASYRLLPQIKIIKAVPPSLAEKFQACFSPGVIRIDARSKEVSVDEEKVRNDTVSREVLRHPELAEKVELGRVRDWFLFKVESEGPYSPERLLPEAVKVMREKLSILKKAAEGLRDKANAAAAAAGAEATGASGGGDGDVVMGS